MKKILALVLALAMCLTAFSVMAEGTKVKIGFIFLHDENSTYDKNFMDAAKAACEELKLGTFNYFKDIEKINLDPNTLL